MMDFRHKIVVIVSCIFSIIPNLMLFGFRGLKIPILFHFRTVLELKGEVIILTKLKFGIIRVGFGGPNGIEANRHNYFLIRKGSKIIFQGKVDFARGTSVRCDSGTMKFGNDCMINTNSFIFCKKSIELGHRVLVGWNVSIIDNDGHEVNGTLMAKNILINQEVWIGAHCYILKGATIPKGSIVAARSVVTSSSIKAHSVHQSNLLLANDIAKIKKEGMEWTR